MKSGRQAVKVSASAEDGDADGFGHAGIGVGTEQALDARLDGESFALDFGDGVSEFGGEMRAEGNDSQFDFGMCSQVRGAANRDGYSRRGKW